VVADGACFGSDREAIVDRLLPAFAQELRMKMLADAREVALLQVSDKLWSWARRAPFQVSIQGQCSGGRGTPQCHRVARNAAEYIRYTLVGGFDTVDIQNKWGR